MSDDSTLQFVQRLFVAAARRKLPDDLAEVLMVGLAAYQRGEFKTLDDAFGIRSHGMKSVCYQVKIRERDRLLKQIAELICIDSNKWERAKRLSETIKQFESRILPRLRKKENPKANIPQWQVLLYKCFELDVKVPSSGKGLLNIL